MAFPGVVEVANGLMLFFSGERPSLDNNLTGEGLNNEKGGICKRGVEMVAPGRASGGGNWAGRCSRRCSRRCFLLKKSTCLPPKSSF